jgi:cytochrome c
MNRAAVIVLLLLTIACNRAESPRAGETAAATPAPAGNVEKGKLLAVQYGCNVCHILPGVEGPQGALGPSLEGLASRPTISYNAVQNTPENLVKYIQNPPAMNPQSTMPALGIAEGDVKDIAAYLMTLK